MNLSASPISCQAESSVNMASWNNARGHCSQGIRHEGPHLDVWPGLSLEGMGMAKMGMFSRQRGEA